MIRGLNRDIVNQETLNRSQGQIRFSIVCSTSAVPMSLWVFFLENVTTFSCFFSRPPVADDNTGPMMLFPLGRSFRCAELLFRPRLFGVPSARGGGIDDAVRGAIDACRPGVRDTMYDNIVLAGGCTVLPSLADRLARALYRPDRPAVVDAPVGRKYATWLGGSVLASAVGVERLLIDRLEYEESGTRVVHRKTVF